MDGQDRRTRQCRVPELQSQSHVFRDVTRLTVKVPCVTDTCHHVLIQDRLMVISSTEKDARSKLSLRVVGVGRLECAGISERYMVKLTSRALSNYVRPTNIRSKLVLVCLPLLGTRRKSIVFHASTLSPTVGLSTFSYGASDRHFVLFIR